MLRSADRVQAASADGQLFRLPQLESRLEWNGRARNLVSLQYAQSHMAVRYLAERYGESASIKIVQEIGRGENLADAIRMVTRVDYPQLESDFALWLTAWDEPRKGRRRVRISKSWTSWRMKTPRFGNCGEIS